MATLTAATATWWASFGSAEQWLALTLALLAMVAATLLGATGARLALRATR